MCEPFFSVRHPQSNPVERIMRELGRFFRIFCAEHAKWAIRKGDRKYYKSYDTQ